MIPSFWGRDRLFRSGQVPGLEENISHGGCWACPDKQQGEEGRKLANIPGNLIRLCVGGEHPDDVIADLDQALCKVPKR